MDNRAVIRSLVDAALSIEEYLASKTPMSDPEVKDLYGKHRSHVNTALYNRGYTAHKYRSSKKGGEFFTRIYRHPKGHNVELRFDGDEVVRKATGSSGPREARLSESLPDDDIHDHLVGNGFKHSTGYFSGAHVYKHRSRVGPNGRPMEYKYDGKSDTWSDPGRQIGSHADMKRHLGMNR